MCRVLDGWGRREVPERTKGPFPPPSSSTHSWFNSYTKLMQILSGAPLPPSVDIPYSVPIQDWSQMVSWRPTSYLWWLLMQILYRTNRIPLWHPLPPPVHISYLILIQSWCISSLDPPSPGLSESMVFLCFMKDFFKKRPKCRWGGGHTPTGLPPPPVLVHPIEKS